MLYIIDKQNFEGTIEARMPDGIKTQHSKLTLAEFRTVKNNPDLITVTTEEFEMMRDRYIKTLITPFSETSEEVFFGIFKEEKIKTGILDKGYACFFFDKTVGFSIYDCYCEVKGRYYTAKKVLGITRKEIEDEIKQLYKEKNTKNVIVLDFYGSLENDELCRYLDKYDIKNIAELFDHDTCKIKIREHDYLFIKIEEDNNLFVIYWDSEYDIDRKELETILFLFFSDGFEEHFTKKYSTWSDYTEGCIAFKEWGQSTFAIWQYNGDLPQQKIK